jgi:hypothetical protein
LRVHVLKGRAGARSPQNSDQTPLGTAPLSDLAVISPNDQAPDFCAARSYVQVHDHGQSWGVLLGQQKFACFGCGGGTRMGLNESCSIRSPEAVNRGHRSLSLILETVGVFNVTATGSDRSPISRGPTRNPSTTLRSQPTVFHCGTHQRRRDPRRALHLQRLWHAWHPRRQRHGSYEQHLRQPLHLHRPGMGWGT